MGLYITKYPLGKIYLVLENRWKSKIYRKEPEWFRISRQLIRNHYWHIGGFVVSIMICNFLFSFAITIRLPKCFFKRTTT